MASKRKWHLRWLLEDSINVPSLNEENCILGKGGRICGETAGRWTTQITPYRAFRASAGCSRVMLECSGGPPRKAATGRRLLLLMHGYQAGLGALASLRGMMLLPRTSSHAPALYNPFPICSKFVFCLSQERAVSARLDCDPNRGEGSGDSEEDGMAQESLAGQGQPDQVRWG